MSQKRVVKNSRTARKAKTDKALPLGLIVNFAMGFIKDAAIKDALNRAVDAMQNYVNGVLIRVDKLEKDNAVLKHSIEMMVKARITTGQMPKELSATPEAEEVATDSK